MKFRFGFNHNRQTYIKLYNNWGFYSINGIRTEVHIYKTLAIYIFGYYLNIDFLNCSAKMRQL